ncbi:MAG: MarR family winged helix-turn-helix transcriptional regulator [Reyranella sp.]
MTAAEVKATLPINILDLAHLISTASRVISGLAALPPFKQAEISLTEWLVLSVLSSKDGVSNKLLARSLGVTGQRANQLCTSLSKARLISVAQAEDDNRRNVIKITEAGRRQLDTVNSQLQELVTRALANKQRALVTANKQMRLIMRIVQAGNPGKVSQPAMLREGKKRRSRVSRETTGAPKLPPSGGSGIRQ